MGWNEALKGKTSFEAFKEIGNPKRRLTPAQQKALWVKWRELNNIPDPDPDMSYAFNPEWWGEPDKKQEKLI